MATIINGDGIVTAEGTSTTQGRLRLGEDTDNGTNYVELQAAANIASNVTFTLPSADGTANQVLQTNGSGTLSFATPAGGSWTYLSTVTASNSATVDVETTFSSTYDAYAIIGTSIVTASDAVALRCRLKINGSYQTGATDYKYMLIGFTSASGTNAGSAANSIGFISVVDDIGNASGEGVFGFVSYVFNPAGTSLIKTILSSATYQDRDGGVGGNWTSGGYAGANSTAALTGVRFYATSGNITSGAFRLYGIKNS